MARNAVCFYIHLDRAANGIIGFGGWRVVFCGVWEGIADMDLLDFPNSSQPILWEFHTE